MSFDMRPPPPIKQLEQEMEDRLAARKQEVERLLIFKHAIWKMASVRLKSVDDYIMIAKQAIADYESLGGKYSG